MIEIERFYIYSGVVGWGPDGEPIFRDGKAELVKFLNRHPDRKLISVIPDLETTHGVILFFDIPDQLKERDEMR